MRYLIIALSIFVASALPARAQFSIDFSAPGVSIGVNMPVYPQLVRIPGYPVYYDPYVNSNYFFYDGLYWVYWGDNWYTSEWYNGPWQLVGPEYVPQFLLLVPVRYYRSPPSYFRSWYRDSPPRWGEHWGRTWEQRRSGWDRWDRRSVPAAAPLPVYQRQYTGSRYPRATEQQQVIRTQNYRYQPRDAVVQQNFRQRGAQGQLQGQQQQQQVQPQGNVARPRVQTQQPVQQGTAPQVEQQRQQMNRQRQQQLQQQQQQQQQSTQTQTGQGRPAQSGAQIQGQGRQNGPQERARANAGPPQAQGPEPKGPPRETRAAPQGAGPQGGGGENRGQQARGGENRQGPPQAQGGQQGKGEEKGARKGQVKQDENKKE